jgi:hypothetical protein
MDPGVSDDTLFTRPGKKVFGAAWHHDGTAKGPKPLGFGTCWVVAGIVAQLPFLSRPVCLPVLVRVWRPHRTGKIAHARETAELIAAGHPARRVHVAGDAADAGEHLRGLDTPAHLDQQALRHLSAARTTSATHRTLRPAAHHRRRLGTPTDLAATRPGAEPRCAATAEPTPCTPPK